MEVRFGLILLCLLLPGCAKINTPSNSISGQLDTDRKTLIDKQINERFDFSTDESLLKDSYLTKSAEGMRSRSLCKEKLFDIPIPMQAVFTAHGLEENDQGVTVEYNISIELLQLKEFYNREMERLGWQECIENSSAHEILLVFMKPHNACAISIRSQKDKRKGLLVIIKSGIIKKSHLF